MFPTVATTAQQAAAWPEQPGQDKSLQPVWFRPDDGYEAFPQPVPPFDASTQAAALTFDAWEPSTAVRWFAPDAEADGGFSSWLWWIVGPAAGATPAILIDATTGDPYIHLDGPFIARVD